MIAAKIKSMAIGVVFVSAILGGQTHALAQAPCPSEKGIELTGAGSTFSFPLYSKMFEAYQKLCGIKVNYLAIGSGAGIRQFQDMTVDFGASDGIMTSEQLAKAKGGEALHIPTTIGAVAITYNLPITLSESLKLTPDVLADIYRKKITKWNDARIAALNPQVPLPNIDITVVYRSDGSGTTFILTNYLSKVSPEWADKIGFANSVTWPTGTGANGNAGVASQVKQVTGAIGYVEFSYAVQNRLLWGTIRNKAGKFVAPTLQGAASASNVADLPDDMKIVITDSDAPDAYPISGFSWLLIYKDGKDQVKSSAIAHLVWWMIHEGQQVGEALHYAPLKDAAVKKAEELLRQITVDGQSVLATK